MKNVANTPAQILVADDDQDIRNLLAYELKGLGHEITLAQDGHEAQHKIDNRHFELVLLDIRMPKADGIEVLHHLQRVSPETLCIMVSGKSDLESAIECLRAGAYDFLRKPSHLDQLLPTVHRALERQRLRATTRLYETCVGLFSRRDEMPLSQRVVQATRRLVNADVAALALLTPDQQLELISTAGADQPGPELCLRCARTSVQMQEPLPLLWPDDVDQEYREDVSFHSGIMCPLQADDSLFGVLSVYRNSDGQRYRRRDVEVLSIIATIAALAMHNEKLTRNLLASERMAAIGQVAASVVHEIRNPLTCIVVNAEMAREHASDNEDTLRQRASADSAQDELLRMLADIEHSATRLREIINDVQGLSKSSSSLDEVFDVNVAIRSALRVAKPGLCADLKLDLGENTTIMGNLGRMSQVVLNLIMNASQAIEDNDQSDGCITIRTRRAGVKVHISVADNGPGIPPQHLPFVLEPFFTTKCADSGIGLGLSICKDIVAQHNGKLQVVSSAHNGAEFRIQLPSSCSRSLP